jgi:hypothetical protein
MMNFTWRWLRGRFVAVLMGMLAVGGLTGCGAVRNFLPARKSGVPEMSHTERMRRGLTAMGSIYLVDAKQGFVLIQVGTAQGMPEEAELIAVTAVGETARLRLTPERRRNLIAADIVSGTPVRGQSVFFYRAPNTPKTAAGATGAGAAIDPLAGEGPSMIEPLPDPSMLGPVSRPSDGSAPPEIPHLPDLPEGLQ